jgi:fructokinase
LQNENIPQPGSRQKEIILHHYSFQLPAVNLLMQYKAVCFGEILWDVLPSATRPGGAPMNVAFHLQTLGFSAALISKVGKDAAGAKLLKVLDNFSMPADYLQTDVQHATGVVNATVKESNEVEYEIVYPVAWDFIEYEKSLVSLVQNASYFIFGSLAARNEISRNTLFRLLEAANTKVFDINLRPPHFNKTTVERLLSKADVVKLNEHELKLVSGWLGVYADTRDQVNSVQQQYNLKTVLVTKGDKGALVKYKDDWFSHDGYKVKVADTVGSGDAFLAGLLFQLENKKTISEALPFANAVGAFVATQSGACPSYNLSDIHQLMNDQ